MREPRLREIDYGTLTRRPIAEIDAVRLDHTEVPFPQGESWHDAVRRHESLLVDLAGRRSQVLLIGHSATHVASQHLCVGISAGGGRRRPAALAATLGLCLRVTRRIQTVALKRGVFG